MKEYIFEKEFSYPFGIKGFVARDENHPLRKAMVDHNHQRVIAMRGQEVSDQVDGQLLKQAGADRGDRGECRDSWMGIDLHLLAKGAPSNKTVDEGRHTWPPVVPRQQGICTEEPPMARSKG